MKKFMKNIVIIMAVLMMIASCKVGPNYRAPADETPQTFRYTNNATDSIINLQWWDLFHDPVLDTLIATALRQNKDLLIAASRIEQARANVKFRKADYGPKIGVQAGAGVTNQLFNIPGDNNFEAYNAAGTFNWELDFWGKFRRSTEAAQAEMLGSFYGKRAIEIALISEVATNYFELLDYKARLRISESTLALRDSTLQIIQARFDEGYTHIIDVNQAEIQKGITQASVPRFKRFIAFTEHNLNLLMGKNMDSILTFKDLQEYQLPDSIPTGIPSEILQRRPDILQSEQLYRSQNANVGVAVAQRFPSINLTGMLGLGSADLSNLLSNGLGWSAGASLLGPLFEWGKNARRVDIERELAKQYLLEYERTVLTALLEVNNALVELSTYKEELIANAMKMRAARNASSLSRQRYYQGVTSYLEVIENQRQEFDARLAYSENYQLLLNSYIALYKSLGGGWVSEAELEKYAAQVAEEQNVDVNTINVDSLYYHGQVVDFYLTPEQEAQRKEARKALRIKEKEARKAAKR
jgi:multidrug efflux system outer membrane protein